MADPLVNNSSVEVDPSLAQDGGLSPHSTISPPVLQLNTQFDMETQEPPRREPFSRTMFQKDQDMARARAAYFKVYAQGLVMVSVMILVLFSVFWGAFQKLPVHPLSGWIVDFDGAEMGRLVSQNLMATPSNVIAWQVKQSTRFPGGSDEIEEAIKENHAWIAVTINAGSTARLQNSLATPNASYDGTDAVTVYLNEARNENAFRVLLRPDIKTALDGIKLSASTGFAARLASLSSIESLLAKSPQTVVNPLSYTLVNVIPFSQPVATAPLTGGLIFLLLVSYCIVGINNTARIGSSVDTLLTLPSLIGLRLGSSFAAYFVLAFMYSLLNAFFGLNLSHTFGSAGFFIFWMFHWAFICSVGLALEALVIILKQYISFFLILWIIINCSIIAFPPPTLPALYGYGFGAPFMNISKAVRYIVFGARHELGRNFGILFAWIVINCITLIAVQWYVRQRDIQTLRKNNEKNMPPRYSPHPDYSATSIISIGVPIWR